MVFQRQDMQEITCKHCGYHWITRSTKTRISCSKCKTSITIKTVHPHEPKPIAIATIEPETDFESYSNIIEHKSTEVKFPPSLWKDARLSQRFMGLENMGEKYVILKVDGEGVLSL